MITMRPLLVAVLLTAIVGGSAWAPPGDTSLAGRPVHAAPDGSPEAVAGPLDEDGADNAGWRWNENWFENWNGNDNWAWHDNRGWNDNDGRRPLPPPPPWVRPPRWRQQPPWAPPRWLPPPPPPPPRHSPNR